MKQVPASVALIASLCGLGIVVSAAAPSATAAPSPYEKFDDHFRKYTKRYFGGGFDWRLFKAQAIVESNLKPNAVSSRGARGVMQLVPSTYAEARKRNPGLGDINSPESNIGAGIWYAHEQWAYWEEEAEKKSRRQFMLGSYNAGRGTLVRAQQLAQAAKLNYRRWPSVEKVAPRVPNWRYKETLAYVQSVFVNLSSLDRQGRVKGPTISKDGDPDGLPDKLKRFLGFFKRFGHRNDDD